MWVESSIREVPLTSEVVAPKRYLRAVLAVARSANRGEYEVVYFSSGSFFRTDRLGALAVRALIAGKSDAEAMELVERIDAGAGDRVRRLIDVLDLWHATTPMPPLVSGPRRGLRRLAARTAGLAMSALGSLVHLAPTAVLARIGGILPSTLITEHLWWPTRVMITNNLRASCRSGRPEPELLGISRRCVAAPSSNYLFMYLGSVLSSARLGRLVDRLFDRGAVRDLAVRLEAAGPTVIVFLHGPFCVAVPNAMRAAGRAIVRLVVPWTHGFNVSEGAGPLRDFFGDSPELTVVTGDPLVSGVLLRHLKAGRSVYTALDEPIRGRKAAAEVEMLGQRFPRNDAPAWLAVRSRRPIVLCTTHSSPFGIVINASPLLHPDPLLAAVPRAADLSERLYACAEAAIREHPEGWGRGWVLLGRQSVPEKELRLSRQTARSAATRRSN